MLNILRTADVLRRHYEKSLDRSGITLQQYNVLRILRGAHPGGLPTLEVASRMVELEPGITRLIDRLEGKRLVVRVQCTLDRRRVWCRLSPAGLRAVNRLDSPVRSAEDRSLGRLSRTEALSLIRLLEKVRSFHSEAPTPSKKKRRSGNTELDKRQ